jgi:integrase
MFQEGEDETAEAAFREIARITHGAYARFDAGAADQLRDLLKLPWAAPRRLKASRAPSGCSNNSRRSCSRPTIEIEIIREDEIKAVLQKLRGRAMYMIATLGLATGMRRGELLALRWSDVNLDDGKLRVEQSLEQTKAGLRFKSPKTKHGRRTITIPPSIVAELRLHRKKQQERRLALGAGKAPADALVFPTWDFAVRSPNALTKKWSVAMAAAGLSISLHALRHTHASSLIAAGVDVLTISRRLGHASPTVTLGVYGHLFSNTDDRAAQVIEELFAKVASTE